MGRNLGTLNFIGLIVVIVLTALSWHDLSSTDAWHMQRIQSAEQRVADYKRLSDEREYQLDENQLQAARTVGRLTAEVEKLADVSTNAKIILFDELIRQQAKQQEDTLRVNSNVETFRKLFPEFDEHRASRQQSVVNNTDQ